MDHDAHVHAYLMWRFNNWSSQCIPYIENYDEDIPF